MDQLLFIAIGLFFHNYILRTYSMHLLILKNKTVHQFFVPIPDPATPKVITAKLDHNNNHDQQEKSNHKEVVTRYRVWGMTARILIDAARIAYAREPEFEHNRQPGDEEMITALREMGRLGPVVRDRDRIRRRGSSKLS